MASTVPILLGQVATVRDTYERETEIDRVNGELGIRVGIRKQARANTVEVSQAILEELEAVERDYPQVNIVAVSNSGNFIERSIANVARSVLYGGVLSVLVTRSPNSSVTSLTPPSNMPIHGNAIMLSTADRNSQPGPRRAPNQES